MVEDERFRAEVAAHRKRSAELMELFAQRGIDLSGPRPVVMFFTAVDESQARRLVSRLVEEGLVDPRVAPTAALMEASGVTYGQGEAPASWSVQATMTLSLQRAASDEAARAFCRIAADYAASYDGWGI